MNDRIVVCTEKGAQMDLAASVAKKLDAEMTDKPGKEMTLLFSAKSVSLIGYGLTYQGDFESMLRRVTEGRLQHELLVQAAKAKDVSGLKAIDATAGMGEDSFLLAAYGYEVTMYEQNPVIAVLLKDALRRAKKHPQLKEIAARMKLVEGNSVELLANQIVDTDLIYLDPMFPSKQKSSLTNKKLQLIQKLEPPCSAEEDLFNAALKAEPSKIIVKRPMKAPVLAGRTPSYSMTGKSIRYDCYMVRT